MGLNFSSSALVRRKIIVVLEDDPISCVKGKQLSRFVSYYPLPSITRKDLDEHPVRKLLIQRAVQDYLDLTGDDVKLNTGVQYPLPYGYLSESLPENVLKPNDEVRDGERSRVEGETTINDKQSLSSCYGQRHPLPTRQTSEIPKEPTLFSSSHSSNKQNQSKVQKKRRKMSRHAVEKGQT